MVLRASRQYRDYFREQVVGAESETPLLNVTFLCRSAIKIASIFNLTAQKLKEYISALSIFGYSPLKEIATIILSRFFLLRIF